MTPDREASTMSIAELTEKQGEVVKLQSDIIDELFLLLLQHISVEDIDAACLLEISEASRIRHEIE